MFNKFFTNLLSAIIKPIAIKLLDEEIKSRVKFEVERELSSQIKSLSAPQKIKITKKKKNDLGELMEFLSKTDIDLENIEFKIQGKSDIDTNISYSKRLKNEPTKALFHLIQPSHMDKLRTKLHEQQYKYFSEFTIRLRFEYQGESHYKGFYLVNDNTDMESIIQMVEVVYKTMDDTLQEFLI